jgi:hypothetical protein
MASNRPPVIAAWLLKHFGCGPNNDAVLGDLAEQYAHRNRVWYWRQVLKSIPVSVIKEALRHKRIAITAIVTGWIVWLSFVVLIYPLFTAAFLRGNNVGVDIELLHPLGSAWSALWAPVLFATSLNPTYPMIFLLWIQIALPFIVWTLCGWIVTRVDLGFRSRDSSGPRHIVHVHRDLAPLLAGSILLLSLLFIGPFITVVGPRAYSFIGPLAGYTAVSVVGILVGGSLRRDRDVT